MEREIFEVKATISYLVGKAIVGNITDYENRVLEAVSVLADSLLRHERDLSRVTFHVGCECKKK